MSSTTLWDRAKGIVADALELERVEERAALVNARCAGDDALRAEVESLLGQTTTGFDACAESGPTPLRSAIAPGTMIGAYSIEHELGRGGMGAVYLARRADGVFDKQVAIKLLKRGMDTDDILRRFAAERRILARLDHPNIARLLDAGTTDDGLPYFVMEYIEGVPITRFVVDRRCSLHERLSLFRTVCDAVNYAHRSLIVHRDLKPSNTLVTPAGELKLLDFGIAKLILEADEAAVDVTATAWRVMTPEYASPEQLKGEAITTQADVYSLGLILYELLTSMRPFRTATRTPLERAKAIATREAQRPSTAAAKVEHATRQIDPRQLRGDIDKIVLKAIKPDPTRRYGSALELSEDLRRYLGGLPVKARGDNAAYRVGKFVQRHKVAVSVAAAIVALLIGATLVTSLEAARERRERKEAQLRFEQVRQLAHSLLFDYYDELARVSGSTGLRQKLAQDALRYLDNLSAAAGNNVGILRELGAAYERLGAIQGNSYYANLGDTAAAKQSYKKSLAIRERLVANNPDDPQLLADLAASREGLGDVFAEEGKLHGAFAAYRAANALRERVLATAPDRLEYVLPAADLVNKIGDLQGLDGYANLGDTAGALASYKRGEALLEPRLSDDPAARQVKTKLAVALSHSSMVADSAGEIETALHDARRAVQLLEDLSAAEPTNNNYRNVLLAANAFLRFALLDDNEIAEAIERGRKVIAELERLVAADPTNASARRNLSVAYNSLGKDVLSQGDVAGALAQFAAAKRLEDALTATNPASEAYTADTAFTLARVGEAKLAARDPAAAQPDFEKAMELRQEALKTDPANARARAELAVLYQDLGEASDALGQIDEAKSYYAQSVQLGEELSAESPTNAKRAATLAARYLVIADFYRKLGDQSAAQSSLKRSVAIWEQLSTRHAILPVFTSQAARATEELDQVGSKVNTSDG